MASRVGGQRLDQGGKHRPVRPGQPQPADLAMEHGDLAAQDEEFDGNRGLSARAAAASRTSEPHLGTTGRTACP